MNRKLFYDSIRATLFKGHLSTPQVEGIEAILNYYLSKYRVEPTYIAYVLATAYHETAHTLRPIEEYGKGKGKPYGSKFKMGGGPNKRVSYFAPDELYYGRGFVQLTWYENYEKVGKYLGEDLLFQPELAMDPKISAAILVEGMVRGWFTGFRLSTFVKPDSIDYKGARRIINGTDKCELIASYAQLFKNALEVSIVQPISTQDSWKN